MKKFDSNKWSHNHLNKIIDLTIKESSDNVKQYPLFYGEGITHSNKLVMPPYHLNKEKKEEYIQKLTEKGYDKVGWVNLNKDAIEVKYRFRVGRPQLVNRFGGAFTGFLGFDGVELVKHSESFSDKPQDLYFVKLSYNKPSGSSGFIDISYITEKIHQERMERIWDRRVPDRHLGAINLISKETNDWAYDDDRKRLLYEEVQDRIEMGELDKTNIHWLDPINLAADSKTVAVIADPSNKINFNDLETQVKQNAFGGLINSMNLEGTYKTWKVGRLEKVPNLLFGVQKEEKIRDRKNNGYPRPHIDMHYY